MNCKKRAMEMIEKLEQMEELKQLEIYEQVELGNLRYKIKEIY